MTLQALPDAIVYPVILNSNGAPSIGTISGITLDAAGEYVAMIFCAREAMTISHVGFGVTTATGSPTADVRIETVATDGLPSGTLWATNTNLVTGALSTGFTLHALTASASISAGERFCVKVAYNSGTTLALSRLVNTNADFGLPYAVFNTGTPTKQSANLTYILTWALGSSTSTFYRMHSILPATVYTTTAFDNTDGGRRGVRFRIPFTCRCGGLVDWNGASTGNYAYSLYDDAGSLLESASTDGNHSAESTAGLQRLFFDTPQTLSANTWYRLVKVPSEAVNDSISVITLPSADYMNATGWGVGNAHYTTFTTSGGWIDTATDQIPLHMRLLIDQMDDGAGGGGGGGVGAGLHRGVLIG